MPGEGARVVTTPTRPVLRYHGGKWTLAPWLLSLFPAHRVYVEPYGGGASVLMRKERSYAEVYNDLDGEVVNVFRVLQLETGAARLRELLTMTPFAREEYRLSFELATDPVEQARRTLVRSFMGFGSNSLNRNIKSGFRSNSNRSGTTPAHDWLNWPDQIEAFTARLRGVVLENRRACELLPRHDTAHTLFYVDPPYPHSTRSTTTTAHGSHGYAHEMTDDDHRELATALHGAAGMVLLSGYACELYDRELYPDWHRIERPHFADGARERTEVVWLNPACSRALREQEQQRGLFSDHHVA